MQKDASELVKKMFTEPQLDLCLANQPLTAKTTPKRAVDEYLSDNDTASEGTSFYSLLKLERCYRQRVVVILIFLM